MIKTLSLLLALFLAAPAVAQFDGGLLPPHSTATVSAAGQNSDTAISGGLILHYDYDGDVVDNGSSGLDGTFNGTYGP